MADKNKTKYPIDNMGSLDYKENLFQVPTYIYLALTFD